MHCEGLAKILAHGEPVLGSKSKVAAEYWACRRQADRYLVFIAHILFILKRQCHPSWVAESCNLIYFIRYSANLCIQL
jgi:hypothetical protein